jgi:hypothetical protein
MFWVAWRVAVRITAPHSRFGGARERVRDGMQERVAHLDR